MSFNRKFIYFIQKYFRNNLLKKSIFILSIFSFLLIISILLLNKKSQLCNPEKQLWWFCPWPNPKTTVCHWDEHFPTIQQNNR